MGNFQTILIPTTDIAASRDLYAKLLGTSPIADADYYVGFEVDGQHIGLVPGAEVVTAYLQVADLDTAIQSVTDAGGSVLDAPQEVGGGRRVAVVQDPSGARFGFTCDAT